MPSLFMRPAVQPEGSRRVELWRRVGRAEEQIRRVDAELVHVNGMRRVDALTDREGDLVSLVHDDLRPVAPGVVFEPVVPDGRLPCLRQRMPRRETNQSKREREQGPRMPRVDGHVAYTISAARSPAAVSASIPSVARPTSMVAR
jgi:hypothetical protein